MCTHTYSTLIQTHPSHFSVICLEILTRNLFSPDAFQSSGEIWCAVTLNIQSDMVAKAGHYVRVCMCAWFIPPHASGGSQTWHEIVCQQLGPVSSLLLLLLNLKSAFILNKHRQVTTQTVQQLCARFMTKGLKNTFVRSLEIRYSSMDCKIPSSTNLIKVNIWFFDVNVGVYTLIPTFLTFHFIVVCRSKVSLQLN